MHVQINPGEVDLSDAIYDHANKAVDHGLGRFSEQITRVEVHLHDDNGRVKSGIDKRCVMEARLAGMDPFAVENTAESLYDAIDGAAGKLQRVIEHRLGKLEARSR